MEKTLLKGKQIQDDCAAVVQKLREMLHSSEEQLQVHRKQTFFLMQLTAKTPQGRALSSSRQRTRIASGSTSLNSSYEGDRLNFLLQAIQRKIDTARALDGDVLSEKLWFKQQFAIGVNEVTRLLEWMPPFSDSRSASQKPNATLSTTKGSKLQVILVASDCNPRWLIRHLPSLVSSRNVPLIFIKDKKQGSLRLGELIKLKTAIAVGIKDKGNAVNHFMDKMLLGDDIDCDKEGLEQTEASLKNIKRNVYQNLL